jgi:hypothetical protein
MGGAVKAVASVASAFTPSGLLGLGINLALGVAAGGMSGSLFGKEPEFPSSGQFKSSAERKQSTVTSSVESRKVIYGRVKSSGPIVFVDTNGTDDKRLHMVIALCEGEIEDIMDVYLDNKSINKPKYDGLVSLNIKKGTPTQSYFSSLFNSVGNKWDSTHKLSGIACFYIKLTYDKDKFPEGRPRNYIAIVKGKKLFDLRDSTTLFSENPVLAIYDYLTNATYGLEVASDRIDSATFMAAANTCEERVLVSVESANMAVDVLAEDTLYQTSKRLDFVTGDGIKVTTTGTLPSPLVEDTVYYFIENVYSSTASKINFRLATSYENAISGTYITITASGSGTNKINKYDQVRYSLNGIVNTESKPIDILEEMLTSMAGTLVFQQGKYFIYAAEAGSPTLTFDEDDLSGPIKVKPKPSRSETFNAVRGTYVSPRLKHQLTDYPPVKNSLYATQDGETIYRDIEFPFVNNATLAQRLAKIHLEKSRQGITVEMPCNFNALQLAVWDVINITNTTLGWSSKEFRVLSWTLEQEGTVMVKLQEESSASYDWNFGDETSYDPAEDTELEDLSDIEAPGAPVITESLYVTTNGSGVKAQALVEWTIPADGFIINSELQFQKITESDWTHAGFFPADVTSFIVLDLEPATYNFRVRVINTGGVSSDFTQNSNIEILGLTEPPSDITNFSLTCISNNAHLRWDQATDLDVRNGGTIKLRYSSNTVDPGWSEGTDLGPALPGVTTNHTVPLLNGTYMIKAIDTTNNESLNPGFITSNVANITNMNVVSTLTENPTFTGVKDRVEVVTGGFLALDETTGGENELSGVYTFSNFIDIGKVATSRVTITLNGTVFDSTSLFDDKAGLFDDASGLFDGGDLTGVEAIVFIRTTNSDPSISGSENWSDWSQIYVGDYTARAFDFQLRLSSENSTINMDIDTLSVQVDAPDIVDAGSLTTSAVGATTVNLSLAFVTAPVVGITINNGSSGDYAVITNVDEDSFDILIKDAGDTNVARTVNWIARGY